MRLRRGELTGRQWWVLHLLRTNPDRTPQGLFEEGSIPDEAAIVEGKTTIDGKSHRAMWAGDYRDVLMQLLGKGLAKREARVSGMPSRGYTWRVTHRGRVFPDPLEQIPTGKPIR